MIHTVTTAPTLAAHISPRPDGSHIVIPHLLPIHVPAAALTLTVAEWLDLDTHSDRPAR